MDRAEVIKHLTNIRDNYITGILLSDEGRNSLTHAITLLSQPTPSESFAFPTVEEIEKVINQAKLYDAEMGYCSGLDEYGLHSGCTPIENESCVGRKDITVKDLAIAIHELYTKQGKMWGKG